MANKSQKKKAAYQAHCRQQVLNGRVNDAKGEWIPYDSNKTMHRDMVAGYRIGGASKKQRRPKDEVE